MDFETYVDRCLLKSESKIKRLCTPLQDCLDIPIFGYYYLDKNGYYCNIANAIKELEYYYGSHLYAHDPYIRNPCFFQSGYAIIQMTSNEKFQQTLQKNYGLNQFFQILYKRDDYMEGFIFAQRDRNNAGCMHFFDKTYLLEKFARYFKLEARSIINNIIGYGYNMKSILDGKFDTPESSIPILTAEKYKHFLKKIDPLSDRENHCVNLYKEGHSAQATAAKLGLSQRTVEHYLDNAKLKFGVSSKREFLEF